jgi:formyl-CoA transferase
LQAERGVKMAVAPGVRPLEGIRVLEMGSLIAGPFASRLFADFGAEVIKVESSDGDPIRTWGVPSPSGSSWWWHVQSRNKQLMSVDLRTTAGQAIIRELATQVDVIIENFRPGRMAKWNLGYEQIAAVNPEIIYVSISGFGQTGPYRSRPGFGNIAESMGGLRYVTGFPDRPPLRVGVSLGDEVAALYAAIGALMSLLRRQRAQDGKGDHVDVALTEAVFSLTEGAVTEYLHAGVIPERRGNQLLRTAPSNIYPTQDGKWMAIGANSPTTFPRLMRAMGREDLLEDPRYSDNLSRVANVAELDEMISLWTQTFAAADLWRALTDAEVPAGPVMNVADIAADMHYQARDMVVPVPSEELGVISMPGVVPKLANHPGSIDFAGNPLGHDTDGILHNILGWTAEKIEAARQAGVIQ